jgi:RimJ/RimL family protein N-acetyltransferase
MSSIFNHDRKEKADAPDNDSHEGYPGFIGRYVAKAGGYSALTFYVYTFDEAQRRFYLRWPESRCGGTDLVIAARYELGYGEVVGFARFSEIDPIDHDMRFFETHVRGWLGARRLDFKELSRAKGYAIDPAFTRDGVRNLLTEMAQKYLRDTANTELIIPCPEARRVWRIYESSDGYYESGGLIPTKKKFVGSEAEAKLHIEKMGERYVLGDGDLVDE